ncbi:uncharacterized protein LOC115628450 [Scaptodrosophila lebanonensis]|uniref:Uncharacterized protein LOC115628450 n=1 Tax=Drosophila lebanonensis TaxID=7225 RepID=A0A6J2U000_DROLE|nr:uncharacterized protein LOC115628450 [Scaptodrosophila lebanonensis]
MFYLIKCGKLYVFEKKKCKIISKNICLTKINGATFEAEIINSSESKELLEGLCKKMNEALYKAKSKTSDGGVNKENIQKDSVKQKLSYSSEVNNNEVELYKELEGQTSDGGVNKENIQKDFEAIGADGFDPILNSTEHSEISSKAVSGYTDTLESLGSNWPESATYDGINSSLTINESFSYEAQLNLLRILDPNTSTKMSLKSQKRK